MWQLAAAYIAVRKAHVEQQRPSAASLFKEIKKNYTIQKPRGLPVMGAWSTENVL